MGVASLVLGILSIVFYFIGLAPVGLVGGFIGIVLGAIARKDPEKQSIATAGLVFSIIGVVIGLIVWIACASVIGAAGCAGAFS